MAEVTRNEAEKIIRNILRSFYIKIINAEKAAKEHKTMLCPEGQLIVNDFYSSKEKEEAVLQAINDRTFFDKISDGELLKYVQFCQQISEFYDLDAQPFERVSKIRPSGAWIVKNSWTECFIKQYQTFVLTNAKKYIKDDKKEEDEKEKYTCEDFALALLIDFSVKNNLPVVIKRNRDIYDSRNSKYNSIIKFKKTVFNKNAADHLMGNTIPIDVSDAKPGDLILMDNGVHGGKKDGIINHVIVITKIYGDFFLLAQGNHTGKKVRGAYYKTDNYQGEPVERRKYNWKTDVYYGSESLKNNEYPDAIKGFGMQFRRWNFKGMEK